MNQPPNKDYEVNVSVSVCRRWSGDDRMSLSQNWTVPEANSAAVFRTLAEFAELAEQIKKRESSSEQHV